MKAQAVKETKDLEAAVRELLNTADKLDQFLPNFYTEEQKVTKKFKAAVKAVKKLLAEREA